MLVRCDQAVANAWLDYRHEFLEIAQKPVGEKLHSLSFDLAPFADGRFYDAPHESRLAKQLNRLPAALVASHPWRNTAAKFVTDPPRHLEIIEHESRQYAQTRCTVLRLHVHERFCRVYGIAFPATRLGEPWNMAVDAYSARYYWPAIEQIAGNTASETFTEPRIS